MRKTIRPVVFFSLGVFLLFIQPLHLTAGNSQLPIAGSSVIVTEAGRLSSFNSSEIDIVEAVIDTVTEEIQEEEVIEQAILLSQEEIELIALVTMAEAEGEPEEGKRLVIDTILNRVDSGYFPDTVYEVVYQKNQFTSMWNGRVERCEVRDDIYQLVLEELSNRTNSEVVFFTAGCYSNYGVPLLQVGNHYFSKYE